MANQLSNSIDYAKLRYVLYVRRSSEDESRQVRSLDDQAAECRSLAKRNGYTIVKEIREAKSAKKPNNRKKFRKLLDDIKAGKYDGIVSWHPDRLSRNMLESGEIIDMLDNNVLKDLRFVSHQFSNDANGKMLLGMLFVFSKQYSEDLSEKVKRGTLHNLDEGKSAGIPKWGYDRNQVTGLYEPDDNFELVKKGWEMRLEGRSYREIHTYWRSQDLHRMSKITDNSKVQHKITLKHYQSLSRVFKDPFYFGILNQSGRSVDLRDKYQFKPMITRDEYEAVQELNYTTRREKTKHKRLAFLPLRDLVFCGVCGGKMIPSANRSSNGTKYLRYACLNKDCSRRPKSVKARDIFTPMCDKLDNLKFDDRTYKKYEKQFLSISEEKIDEIRNEFHSLRGVVSKKKEKFEELSLNIGRMSAGPVRDKNQEVADGLYVEIGDLDQQVQKLNSKLKNSDKLKMAKEDFLNLINTLPEQMRDGNVVHKDQLARSILLNLYINEKNEPVFLWKEPLDRLLNNVELTSGGDMWT